MAPTTTGASVGTAETILLGFIAGATIFLGLPLGRMRGGSRGLRTFLNGLSAGILVFLLLEIFEHAFGSVEDSFNDLLHRGGSLAHFAGMAALFAAGTGLGLLSLLYVGKM